MCEVDSQHEKYIISNKNWKKIWYVRVLRAIYGCIETALQWCKLHVKTLKGIGFKLNPYDKYVVNKMINVMTEVFDTAKQHFGDLVIYRGDTHHLLGMKIKIKRSDKTISIDMREQIEEAFEMFGEELGEPVGSPAKKNLFKMCNGECQQLDDVKSGVFYRDTAKLLFTMKRPWPDIETTESYLMTRVFRSNEKNWEKLTNNLSFVKANIGDLRITGTDSLRDLHVWVDTARVVHENMRGHTGGEMSMGTGTIHNESSKQKLNTKSTTELELVGE